MTMIDHDRPAIADPECSTCDGTGRDEIFGTACVDCHTGARRRWAEQQPTAAPADRPTPSTPNASSSPRRPAPPAADVDGIDEAELVDWLDEQKWSEFAQSLAAFYKRRGYLTPKQHAAATSMKTKCDARNTDRAAIAPAGTVTTSDSAAGITRTASSSPDVAAGLYAIESPTGLAFYGVDRPTSGRWVGYTFVRRVIGGDRDAPVRGRAAAAVLAAIADDPDAGRRYGREIGRCYRCNRTLTDDESRAAGIGPVCRQLD